jgi:hypothetical protein
VAENRAQGSNKAANFMARFGKSFWQRALIFLIFLALLFVPTPRYVLEAPYYLAENEASESFDRADRERQGMREN